MLIWRLEDLNHRGPYCSLHKEANYWANYNGEYVDINLQPDPEIDFYNWKININYIFGFISKNDGEKWFGKIPLIHLNKLGFFLIEVKAKDIIVSYSEQQVLFLRA